MIKFLCPVQVANPIGIVPRPPSGCERNPDERGSATHWTLGQPQQMEHEDRRTCWRAPSPHQSLAVLMEQESRSICLGVA